MQVTQETMDAIVQADKEGRVTGLRPKLAFREYPDKFTEPDFTDKVIEYAQSRGWLVAHFRPAKTAKGWRTAVQGDGAGFPDLILIRGSRVIAAELKSETGKLSAAQKKWLAAFAEAGVMTFVWFPSDWPEIEKVLA